jgi:FMN phosphatase YigB (HAD superfamily)
MTNAFTPLILVDWVKTLNRRDRAELHAILLEFKTDSAIVCVASDGSTEFSDSVILPSIRFAELYQHENAIFDAIYDLDQMKNEKKSDAYWQESIIDKFGPNAPAIVMLIDDNAENIKAAQNNGIACVWVKEDKTFLEMADEIKAAYQKLKDDYPAKMEAIKLDNQ